MTTLRISITKEVLEATKDCRRLDLEESCAISYAVREIWQSAKTDLTFIRLLDSGPIIRMNHGQKDFIHNFDFATPAERAAMQPFSFEIEVPDEVINEINIEEIRRICEGSKTLEVVK